MTAPWITEPGVYDELDEADYHRDPVVGGSLSSSGARTLVSRTPATFAWQREHGRADTDAFDFGRAAHTVALGVGAPIVAIEADSWRTKAAQQARADARADGATPLLVADAEKVQNMATALRAHPVAGPLLARAGRAERSMFARDPESGVMCRARVDWMPDVDPGHRLVLVDYKSSRSADPEQFGKSIADYGYHQQDPWYCDVARWLGLTGGPDGEHLEPLFVFVVQEKESPHLVTVGRVADTARDAGRVLNRKARDLYAECDFSGEWPGYPDPPAGGIHVFDLPRWSEKRYDDALAAGRYDTGRDLL